MGQQYHLSGREPSCRGYLARALMGMIRCKVFVRVCVLNSTQRRQEDALVPGWVDQLVAWPPCQHFRHSLSPIEVICLSLDVHESLSWGCMASALGWPLEDLRMTEDTTRGTADRPTAGGVAERHALSCGFGRGTLPTSVISQRMSAFDTL